MSLARGSSSMVVGQRNNPVEVERVCLAYRAGIFDDIRKLGLRMFRVFRHRGVLVVITELVHAVVQGAVG